jgi:hypothetical protein
MYLSLILSLMFCLFLLAANEKGLAFVGELELRLPITKAQ